MRTRMRFAIIAGAMLSIVITAILVKNVASKEPGIEPADSGAWEYLVVSGGNSNLESLSSDEFAGLRKRPDDSFREATVLQRNLDKLGAKGWQLVAVNGSPNNPLYYFKRPKERK
jgi:hypothetical protein